MAKNQKNHKSLTSRSKGMIALVVFLAVTVFVSCLGIIGMNLDPEGVRKLLPFVPMQKNMQAYTLSLSLSTGSENTVRFTDPQEGEDRAALLSQTEKILKNRLASYGVTDVKIAEKDGALCVTVPRYGEDDMAMVRAMIASAGLVEFKDMEGNVLLNNSDIDSVRVKYINGYSVLEIKTTKEGKVRLKEATEKTLGSTMGFFLDGQQMVAPQVSEVNSTGAMMMSLGLMPKATKALAAMMENESLPLSAVEVTPSEAASEQNGLYTGLMAAFWIVLAAVCVYMVVRFRAAGLAGAWTMWAYVLCFFFIQSTITLVPVTVGVWAAALVGMLLVAYTSVTFLTGMEKAVAEGRDARSSVRAGFRGGNKMTWLANGVVLLAALLLMILNVTRPVGYTLSACVVASVLVGLGLMRWFVPCLVCTFGSKASAITGKTSK